MKVFFFFGIVVLAFNFIRGFAGRRFGLSIDSITVDYLASDSGMLCVFPGRLSLRIIFLIRMNLHSILLALHAFATLQKKNT